MSFWISVPDLYRRRMERSHSRSSRAQGHQDGGPDKFEDQYETALIDLINQKCAGKPIAAKERPRGENVVDLMDALRKSIGAAAAESSVPKKPTKKPRKASAGQKEMLMPIAGKKQAKETAKKPAARPQRKSA